MKINWAGLGLGTAVLASMAGATSYSSAKEGVFLQAPPGWVQSEFTGTLVIFLAPKPVGSFTPNLNVVVQNIPKTITLKQFHDISAQQMTTYITGAKVLSDQQTTLGGAPAYISHYSGRQGKNTLSFDLIYALKNNKAYILTGTAPLAEQGQFSPLFKNAFKSFKFTR